MHLHAFKYKGDSKSFQQKFAGYLLRIGRNLVCNSACGFMKPDKIPYPYVVWLPG